MILRILSLAVVVFREFIIHQDDILMGIKRKDAPQTAPARGSYWIPDLKFCALNSLIAVLSAVCAAAGFFPCHWRKEPHAEP